MRRTVEEDAALAGLAAGETLRAVEVAAVVLLGLLVCPPLAILAVVVIVPLLVLAVVVAVLSVPYLVVRHLRGHRGQGGLVLGRLRAAGRAVFELAPHRIVADARRLHPRR